MLQCWSKDFADLGLLVPPQDLTILPLTHLLSSIAWVKKVAVLAGSIAELLLARQPHRHQWNQLESNHSGNSGTTPLSDNPDAHAQGQYRYDDHSDSALMKDLSNVLSGLL